MEKVNDRNNNDSLRYHHGSGTSATICCWRLDFLSDECYTLEKIKISVGVACATNVTARGWKNGKGY